jgi:hypothetical protein
MLFSPSALTAIASHDQELRNMSSTNSPPSYYGTTPVSEKPITTPKKVDTPLTHHITLQRCKRTVAQISGRPIVSGIIDYDDCAITIKPDDGVIAVRRKTFSMFRTSWPALMGNAKYAEYSIAISAQYTFKDGDVYGCVHLLDRIEDGIWEFLKRDDIQIINLIVSSAPLKGDAPGELCRCPKRRYIDGLEISRKGKSKHRCVLQ